MRANFGVIEQTQGHRDSTKFGRAVGVVDVITCGKLFGDRFRGVDSVGGQKLPFSID